MTGKDAGSGATGSGAPAGSPAPGSGRAEPSAAALIQAQLADYRDALFRLGPEQARRDRVAALAAQEQTMMSPFIANATLAEGFRRAIPVFAGLGMRMSVVDLSRPGTDAVLEIQRVCPYAAPAAELGLGRPCTVACALDVEAIEHAFAGMRGRILTTLADGAPACLFLYERAAGPTAADAAPVDPGAAAPGTAQPGTAQPGATAPGSAASGGRPGPSD
jgi:hypothetical protein